MFELKQLIGLIMFIRNAYFVAHVVLFSCNFCYKMLDSAIVCYIVSDIGVFCCNLILLQPLYQCSVALLVRCFDSRTRVQKISLMILLRAEQ